MFKSVAVALLVVCCVQAVSIKWIGYGKDHQWTNPSNWSPEQVPTINDDVTIDQGTVQVTIPTGANSITMGDSFAAPANLTFFQTFIIGTGGLAVLGNGNVFINSGTAAVSGKVNIDGGLYFQSGQVSGQWQITSKGVADLSGAAEKAFNGCGFSVAGAFTFGGVMALNQSSQISVTSTVVMSGDVSIQNQDGSATLLDTSAGTFTYTGGGTLQIQAQVNIGTFNFQAGNLSIFHSMQFANPFVIPYGSVVSTLATAVVNMQAGVSGSGVLSAEGSSVSIGNVNISGVVNVIGGNTTFTTPGWVAKINVNGGVLVAEAAIKASHLMMLAGSADGAGGVTAVNASLNCPGFNLNTKIDVTGTFTSQGASLIAFGSRGSISIAAGGQLTPQGPLTFTGIPGRTVTNHGTIVASSPVTFQNTNLGGSGTCSISSTLNMNTATFMQSTVALSGSGKFSGSTTTITSLAKVTGTPGVTGTIGVYKFTCIAECDSISTSSVPTNSFHFVVS